MINAALKGFSFQYNDLSFNKFNKAILIKLGTSEWHMEPMNFENGTAISIACFNPMSYYDNTMITWENDTSKLESAIEHSFEQVINSLFVAIYRIKIS